MAAVSRPVALITTFEETVLPRILAEIAAGPQPPVADWFIGTYGVNKTTAAQVAATPGCRYAPVFSIQPDTSKQARLGRRVPEEVASQLDAAHGGEIPGSSSGAVMPPADRRAWGAELGRRFRDALRAARSAGIGIETWQFDEILSQCASSSAHREFVGGVLSGLAEGRPELGDEPEQGFVWAARRAITQLPGLAITDDVQRFWESLDQATRFLVGEEYPEFRGSAEAAGHQFADAHRALLSSPGPVRKSLGQRYLTGMTPGWRPARLGLGGNVDSKPTTFVTSWRNGFIDARIGAQRPCGFAQFNFRLENILPDRLEDAVRSLHHAAAQHQR